jgi:hypothetical protein
LIEKAYRQGEKMGLPVWVEDEAGPYQTIPYSGESWQPAGQPVHQPHEYIRNGTAKMLTFFHPGSGEVRVKGVTQTTNAVLHPWLKEQILAVLASLPDHPNEKGAADPHDAWQTWQGAKYLPMSEHRPPLRMILVWDNLQGHCTPELVIWLLAHGVLPLYTPLGGSWLNMAESIQRILVRRALSGQHPQTPDQIIGWLEGVARVWNEDPTPFKWGGARAVRRERSRNRRLALGGSGACVDLSSRLRSTLLTKWHSASQLTH